MVGLRKLGNRLLLLVRHFQDRFILQGSLLLLLVAFLYFPAMRGGFLLDDYYWLTILDARPERFWDDLNLLDEVRGSTDVQQLKVQAYVPWWTSPDFKIAYFRPLPSWLHALDYRIWGTWAPGHHLTNIILYGFTVLLVLVLFRQISPTAGRAFFGTLLFTVAENHVLRVYYVSSRNELVALALIITCLSTHIASRRRHSAGFALLSIFCYGMALLSKESAVGVPGLLFLYDFWLSVPGNLRRQLRRFGWHYVALGAITIGFLGLYRIGDYGARSLFFYWPHVDGLFTYSRYASASLALYLFNYAYGMPVFFIPADRLLAGPLLLAFGLCGVLAMSILITAHLHGSPWLRIFTLWLLLPLPLFASSHPNERVLYILSLGPSWVAAMTIVASWQARRLRWVQRSGAALILVGTLLVPFAINRSLFGLFAKFESTFSELTSVTRRLADNPEVEEIVFLNLRQPWLAIWMNYYLKLSDRPTVRYDVLTTKDHRARIIPLDGRSLLIEATENGFFIHPVERLYLTRTQFRLLEEFHGASFVARIERIDEGKVRAIRFTFSTSLADPRRALIVFDGDRYQRFIAQQ